MILRQLEANDPAYADMVACLNAAGLPTSDLNESGAVYFMLGDGVAYGGLVPLADDGLLRSLVVRADRRATGMGSVLLDHLLMRASLQGITNVWLLTTSAEKFFARHGFARADRADAPASVAATHQFRGLCPASAAFMHRRLS